MGSFQAWSSKPKFSYHDDDETRSPGKSESECIAEFQFRVYAQSCFCHADVVCAKQWLASACVIIIGICAAAAPAVAAQPPLLDPQYTKICKTKLPLNPKRAQSKRAVEDNLRLIS